MKLLNQDCQHCLHNRVPPKGCENQEGEVKFVYCCLCDGAGFINPPVAQSE